MIPTFCVFSFQLPRFNKLRFSILLFVTIWSLKHTSLKIWSLEHTSLTLITYCILHSISVYYIAYLCSELISDLAYATCNHCDNEIVKNTKGKRPNRNFLKLSYLNKKNTKNKELFKLFIFIFIKHFRFFSLRIIS